MLCQAAFLRMCHISYCFNTGDVAVTRQLCFSMCSLMVREPKVQLESCMSNWCVKGEGRKSKLGSHGQLQGGL